MHNNSAKNLLNAFILLSSLDSLTFATDYAVGLNMGGGISHNDNIRLVQENETAVRKYVASPALILSATTETSEIRLDSIFDFNRYDKSEYNSDDQNIALSLSRQFENSSVALNAAYINNSTITSELLTSGRIGNNAERSQQYRLSPQWLYNINETNLLQFQASYISQDYHSNSYTGYKNTGAQASWMYKINERLTLVSAATYSDYQSDDLVLSVPLNNLTLNKNSTIYAFSAGSLGQQSYAVRTKSKGLNIGLKYEWSEQTLIEASLGRSKSNTTYPIQDPEDICSRLSAAGFLDEEISILALCRPLQSSSALSSTADVTWKWQSERQHISLNGTKETQPTSNGYAVDSIQVNSYWSYELTELDQFSLSLTLVRNRAIDDKSTLRNASEADRDYGSASLAYQRQINEHWFLRASYQAANQKYKQRDYEANSNIFALNINYRPHKWHWSR